MRRDVPQGYVVIAMQGMTKLLGRIENVLAHDDEDNAWLVALSTEADIAYAMKSARVHAEVWVRFIDGEWVLA